MSPDGIVQYSEEYVRRIDYTIISLLGLLLLGAPVGILFIPGSSRRVVAIFGCLIVAMALSSLLTDSLQRNRWAFMVAWVTLCTIFSYSCPPERWWSYWWAWLTRDNLGTALFLWPCCRLIIEFLDEHQRRKRHCNWVYVCCMNVKSSPTRHLNSAVALWNGARARLEFGVSSVPKKINFTLWTPPPLASNSAVP